MTRMTKMTILGGLAGCLKIAVSSSIPRLPRAAPALLRPPRSAYHTCSRKLQNTSSRERAAFSTAR